MNSKSKFCANCGKFGHMQNRCRNNITSCGVILFKIMNDNGDIDEEIMNNFNDAEMMINNDNNGEYSVDGLGLQILCVFKNRIKFLLVRRRWTLGFLEFIRGQYDVHNEHSIKFLLSQMIQEEIDTVRNKTFDEMWTLVWNDNNNQRHQHVEYNESKKRFSKIATVTEEHPISKLEKCISEVKPIFMCAEWGFPKGKRVHRETNLQCAMREFEEESGIQTDEYKILDRDNTVIEKFMGTNGLKYSTVYYLGCSKTGRLPEINTDIKDQFNEVGEIQWLTYDDTLRLIRPHHTERKRIITLIYYKILNCIKNKYTDTVPL